MTQERAIGYAAVEDGLSSEGWVETETTEPMNPNDSGEIKLALRKLRTAFPRMTDSEIALLLIEF